jgi:hypothetical protein
MRIGNAQSFVEFSLQETYDLQGRADTSCSVEVSGNGFAGKVDSVWFAREDLDRFLSDLEAYEIQRQGSVSLLNMSSLSDYSPLRFEIFSLDQLGHLAVRTDLLKTTYIDSRLTPITISLTFGLDAGMLRSVLEDFRALFNSTSLQT